MNVIYVKKKIDGEKSKRFVGMNSMAAKSPQIKARYPYSPNTYLIWDGLNKKEKEETLRHEIIEKNLIEESKMSYPRAHKISLALEDNKDLIVRGDSSKRGTIRHIRRSI